MSLFRSLNEIHSNKKLNLKSLVDCFPISVEGVANIKSSATPLTHIMIPPTNAGHVLTHEQVMPFLKKLESGQQKEGK